MQTTKNGWLRGSWRETHDAWCCWLVGWVFGFHPVCVGWIELIPSVASDKKNPMSKSEITSHLEKRIGAQCPTRCGHVFWYPDPWWLPKILDDHTDWQVEQESWWIITPWVVTKLAWDICWPTWIIDPIFQQKNYPKPCLRVWSPML